MKTETEIRAEILNLEDECDCARAQCDMMCLNDAKARLEEAKAQLALLPNTKLRDAAPNILT